MDRRDPVTPFITAVLAERDSRAASADVSLWPRRQPPPGRLPPLIPLDEDDDEGEGEGW